MSAWPSGTQDTLSSTPWSQALQMSRATNKTSSRAITTDSGRPYLIMQPISPLTRHTSSVWPVGGGMSGVTGVLVLLLTLQGRERGKKAAAGWNQLTAASYCRVSGVQGPGWSV